jgi:hypothetical protein
MATGYGPGLITAPLYDAQDRLLTYGNAVYAYTANGELLTKTIGAADGKLRLRRTGQPPGISFGGAQIDYLVDGQNRRIGKKMNGTRAASCMMVSSTRSGAGWNQRCCCSLYLQQQDQCPRLAGQRWSDVSNYF